MPNLTPKHRYAKNEIIPSSFPGYMVLYLISTQMLCRASIFLIPMEKTASVFAGLCLLLTTLVNGVMLHQEDFPSYVKWLEYVSPSRWLLPELLKMELSEVALRSSISKEMRCTNKQVSFFQEPRFCTRLRYHFSK